MAEPGSIFTERMVVQHLKHRRSAAHDYGNAGQQIRP
ncbi:hypothetical protein MAXJ12_19498 [Mesorhizobium alhagi CCNWXJ12-2]|uniref:Uncharacterized protein n=1 Tax=Mesorhizobium alhagi CCNWXJ12-2 TaxID=1107882 RepID=H0HUP0_9HYPH|nr:hypothetical protein MAXJ12_19498 [Mesorhizobium alhagi CCNWXJ12-2]